ncbi:MAG: trigger factor [Candidatus Omnitrophica bacterium]|nr:trigger factor [Candidatus Omnitrophota bacterium]
MKKKVKHIEECRKSIEIEVSPAEFKKHINEFYEKIQKVAAVPGFRAGKAPRDLLEKHYSERATKEVVEDLIAHSYRQALEESGFMPLGYPEVNDVKLDEANTLFFKVEFNTRPKLELKNYKGLQAKKKRAEIKDEDVEKSINSLRDANARFKTSEGRSVKIGDYIVCDSEILVEGKPIAKKRENIWMPVEEKSYVPGLSAGLAGANAGDQKEIETQLPPDFPIKGCAGKKAVFRINVKEVKEKQLPNIDDEFAKDLGYNTLAELRESVRKMLEGQAAMQARDGLENQLIEKLLSANPDFEVPSSIINSQVEHLVEDEKKRLLKQGLKEDDIKGKEKELIEKYRPLASKQVKTMFVLNEIADKEKISASDEEVDAVLEEIAGRSRQSKEKVEKYYEDNDLLHGLRTDIINKKVLDFLIKEAKVEE